MGLKWNDIIPATRYWNISWIKSSVILSCRVFPIMFPFVKGYNCFRYGVFQKVGLPPHHPKLYHVLYWNLRLFSLLPHVEQQPHAKPTIEQGLVNVPFWGSLNITFKYLLDIISPMVGWCSIRTFTTPTYIYIYTYIHIFVQDGWISIVFFIDTHREIINRVESKVMVDGWAAQDDMRGGMNAGARLPVRRRPRRNGDRYKDSPQISRPSTGL